MACYHSNSNSVSWEIYSWAANEAHQAIFHSKQIRLMCQVLTHCGFSGVSPNGNCAYVHWGSFTSKSRSVRRAIWFTWFSGSHDTTSLHATCPSVYSTWQSQAVTHPIMNRARRCLTSVIEPTAMRERRIPYIALCDAVLTEMYGNYVMCDIIVRKNTNIVHFSCYMGNTAHVPRIKCSPKGSHLIHGTSAVFCYTALKWTPFAYRHNLF